MSPMISQQGRYLQRKILVTFVFYKDDYVALKVFINKKSILEQYPGQVEMSRMHLFEEEKTES